MNHIHQTLLYLKKNYDPFTRFSMDTLEKVQDGIRFFRIKAGEKIIINTQANRDFLYVTSGKARFQKHDDNHDVNIQALPNAHKSFLLDANDLNAKPLAFSKKDGYLVVTAVTQATVCHADMQFINNAMSLHVVSESDPTNNAQYFMRLVCLQRSSLCKAFPIDVIQSLAQRCEEVHLKKGTLVITQNHPATYFYIIMKGHVEVLQKEPQQNQEKIVAQLESGDSFGEQALITGEVRNASVKMTSDGTLLKLSKANFDNLVSKNIIRSIEPEVAKSMMDLGVKLIDVRFKEEYEENFISGSLLIPLSDLRRRITDLDKQKEYLVICASGTPSIAATVIMKQYGIKGLVIKGGINQWPYHTNRQLSLTLYSVPSQYNAESILITLKESYIPYQHIIMDENNLPDWYQETYANEDYPAVLNIDNKTNIVGQVAINELLAQIASNQLLPSDPVVRSQHINWIQDGIKLLHQFNTLNSTTQHTPFLKQLTTLEHNIQNDEYVRNPRYLCLLDITYAPLLLRLKQANNQLLLSQSSPYPNLLKWQEKLTQYPNILHTLTLDTHTHQKTKPS